jgi:hypothetical protein
MQNRTGIFKGLDLPEIYAIFDDIFNFLTSDDTEICVIASVIMKQKMHDGKDIEKWAYRLGTVHN